MRDQPLQRHVSAWRRCVQMVHGEDLDRRKGGSESSVHFVWGHRTQQDRPEQGPANNAIPMPIHACIYTCHTNANTCMHIYMQYTCIHTYIHIYTHTHTCINTYIHTYIH